MTDEEAIIAMIDSNLQREKISHSEKAYAYMMKNEALKRKVGRKRSQSGHRLKGKKTVELISEAKSIPFSNPMKRNDIRTKSKNSGWSSGRNSLKTDIMKEQGIRPNTIRLSIGTEHIDDIIEDLETAFQSIK